MLIIKNLDPDGIGAEIGLLKGDKIVAFDGKKVEDILDYSYYDSLERFVMSVERDGKIEDYEIIKDEWEMLGLDFEDECYLSPRWCRNKCVFCFVDQLPEGMRKTLYVKDDDYRLSFATGNYVTLTNVSDSEIERIIEKRFSPIYISVHATDEALRRYLLGNKNASDIMPMLKRLADGGIVMHTQVVMCKGLNDGKHLEKTVKDLAALYPQVKSLAVVPVGLTEHRGGLSDVQPIDGQCAAETIDFTEGFNREFYKKHGENFVYCSDEMYVIAERTVPDDEYYGNYEQIENGVGLIREFTRDVKSALKLALSAKKEKFAVITGISAYEYLFEAVENVKRTFPKADITVYPVRNTFFGESVTVAGLLTGVDLLRAINTLEEGVTVLLPRVMLKEFEEVFLDGMTVDELREKTGRNIVIVEAGGFPFVEAVTNG